MTVLPYNVEFVSLCFNGGQFGNHGQVRNLRRCPTKLEDANQSDQDENVSKSIRLFAQPHTSNKH